MSENPTSIKVRYNLQDSVFTHLFQIPDYLLQLFQALHPEDGNVKASDLTLVTLENVLSADWYNDLGFMVGDRLVVLVEAQSTWSPNIVIRSGMYLLQTYKDYIEGTELYQGNAIHLPRPELYVIYTGDSNSVQHGERLSLKETFFAGEESALDITVTVLRDGENGDIIAQYVRFCKVLKEEIKKYGKTAEAVQNAIQRCKEENVLVDYLEKHEKEVRTIMESIFNQEAVTAKRIDIAVNEEQARGRAEKVKMLFSLVKNGDITMERAASVYDDGTPEQLKKAFETLEKGLKS